MEILLIRHADPCYEADTLTDLGKREAQLLADRLVKERIDAIYVSPLGRAQDTMRHTAIASGVEAVACNWMREVWAPAVELHGEHVFGRPVLPGVDNWHEDPLFGKDLHPSYLEISNGFDEVMKAHGYEKSGNVYLVRTHSEKRMVFFSHKWCMLTLLAYLLHWPLPVLIAHCHLSPTGVTRLTWVESPNGVAVPKMICMNDLTHLGGMKYNPR